jgi:hypothetical protein
LKTLEGAPQEVHAFSCIECTSLKSLENAPREVDFFSCNGCTSLKSLENAPREVDFFSCNGCTGLVSVDGAPKKFNTLKFKDCLFPEEIYVEAIQKKISIQDAIRSSELEFNSEQVAAIKKHYPELFQEIRGGIAAKNLGIV